MTDAYVPRWSRRATLQWLAAGSLIPSLLHWTSASARGSAPLSSAGYGTDPDLKNPVAPWPRIMQSHQLQQAALLADLILPATSTAPAPSAIGVPEFIDEWVSAPYPQQRADRVIIFEGLQRVDREAARYRGRDFLEISAHAREEITSRIAQRRTPAGVFEPFFQRFRFLVVGAYYTTAEGWKDIGYIGNVPLVSYPPITSEERARLDAALAKLGVTAP